MRRAAVLTAAMLFLAAPAGAQQGGLVTVASAHALRPTLDRFEAAVREVGWVVFAEVDHAAAARDAGLALDPRIVVLFGNPRAGTPAMAAHPTLALDLPMRILVWQDAAGIVHVTRGTAQDTATRVFARHGLPIAPSDQAASEAMLSALVGRATR